MLSPTTVAWLGAPCFGVSGSGKTLASALCFSLLVWLSPRPALAIDVLLLTTEAEAVATATGATIAAGHPDLESSDFSVASGTATPDLATLIAYDAVLLWATESWDSPEEVGDVLVSYLGQGGSLVLGGESLLSGQFPAGGFSSSSLNPTTGAPSASAVAGDIDLSISASAHPLFSGLSDLRFPDRDQGDPGLSGTGISLGLDSAGNVVAAGICTNQVLVLNIRPSDLVLGEPSISAEVATLFGNALLIASSQDSAVPQIDGANSVAEGETTLLDASSSSPGALGPLQFAWDLDGDGSFDDGSGAEVTFDATGLDGPSSVTVALETSDACSRTEEVSVSLSIINQPPFWGHLSGDLAGELGGLSSFQALAHDVAGDPLTWTWDFGDGSNIQQGQGLTSPSHTWSQPGNFLVTVTVEDDDGGNLSGSLNTTVTNPGPSITLVSPPDLYEALSHDFSASATDALGQSLPILWQWGDNSPTTTLASDQVSPHSYPDNGFYSLTVQTTDSWGESAADSLSVEVLNLPPSIGHSPVLSAIEGQPYLVDAQASDPAGSADTLGFGPSLNVPSSAIIDPTGLTIIWTPTLSDALAGSSSWLLSVSDEDGGETTLSWDVELAILDVDSDGLPDSWETEFGLDPSLDDSLADPDSDGLSNAEEWSLGGNPSSSNAPSAPVPISPADGATVTSLTPTLELGSATDPDGESLITHVELYADAALTQLVDSGQASGDPLQFSVGSDLTENTHLYWRARAEDAAAFGPWTTVQSFFVDVANDPPLAPVLLEPSSAEVATLAPRFLAAEAPEPEEEAVLLFFSYSNLSSGTPAREINPIQLAEGSVWEGSPLSPLTEGHTYLWTAWAMDERGAFSPEAEPQTFVVNASNAAPDPPLWQQPTDDALALSTREPTFCLEVEPDEDGDALSLELQVDIEAGFGTVASQSFDLESVSFEDANCLGPVAALEENASYQARARTVDEHGAASAWALRTFWIDSIPEAPTRPLVLSPGDGEVLASGIELEVWLASAIDPEGGTLVYRVQVLDGGDELAVASGLSMDSEGRVATFDLPVGDYQVRAEALDSGGLGSGWGVANRFSIIPQSGDGVDLGAGPQDGCQCGMGSAPGSTRGLLLCILVGLALCLRRRGCPRPF